MLFPIRCFTCSRHIAHLWDEYYETRRQGTDECEKQNNVFFIKNGIQRYCCRSMFLTHQDTMDVLHLYLHKETKK